MWWPASSIEKNELMVTKEFLYEIECQINELIKGENLVTTTITPLGHMTLVWTDFISWHASPIT